MKLMLPLVFIVLFGFFAVGIPLAAFPAFVRDTLGFGNVTVGVVLGLQSVATLVTRHYSGTVADIQGPRTAVLRGLALTVVSGVVSLSALALDKTASLSLILVARIVLGLGESLLITGALAWGVSLMGPQKAGRVMAWSGMAMYAAIAASAPLAILIANTYSFTGVFVAAIVLPALAGVVALRVPATQPLGKERMPFYKVIHRVWKPGLGLAFSAVSFAALAGFSVLYFKERGWQNASLVMTVFGVTYILARIFFANAPDKFGGKKVALVSLAIAMIGQALVWQATAPFVALLGSALTGFGYSLTFPSFGVEAAKSVEPQFKGVALGAYVAFFDLALGITGPLAGLVAHTFGYPAVYLFGLVASGIAGLIALSMQNRPQENK